MNSDDERRELSDLLARLADGDRDAFGPAFVRLCPRVRELAGRLLGSDHDAADAAQRAMLAVFSRASEYDRERDGLAWSLGITWWECRTLLRASTRRREVTLEQDDRVASTPSPEGVAARRGASASVARCPRRAHCRRSARARHRGIGREGGSCHFAQTQAACARSIAWRMESERWPTLISRHCRHGPDRPTSAAGG